MRTMKATKNLLAVALMTGAMLVSSGASAWWSDDNDYWDGPWGYPGYGGWGGYPGYGGWGGYPGYGGWGGYPGYGGWGGGSPQVIYTQPRQSNPAPSPVIE